MVGLGVIACLLFGFGLASRRLERTPVTGPIVFVSAGLIAGWAGILDVGAAAHAGTGHSEASREAVLVAAELALVLLLFADGAQLDVRTLRHNPLPFRLLVIGLPLTVLLGTACAVALLGHLELWECAILAAVLAPTDAALGRILVASRFVPKVLRDGLSVESGLNDGGAVPFLTLFIALALSEEHVRGEWLRFAVQQIGYGALIGAAAGAAGGLALRRAAGREWTAPEFDGLAFAAVAVIAWLAAEEAGGNGFIAAFIGGAAAGTAAGALRHRVLGFTEGQGQLLNLAVFFLFGLFAAKALHGASAAMVAYAALSLTIVRMASVAIATIGLGLRPAEVALLGWFGPRGLASIVLALAVVDQAPALAGLDEIFLVATITVLLSVFLHGVTAAPLTRRFGGQPALDERRHAMRL